MSHFKYIKEKLFIEKTSVLDIVKKNKTPFYVYSENQIKQNYLKLAKSFKNTNPLICFATKANTNLSIIKILGKLDAGADVVSGGELLKALKAGIKPDKIVFSGVGKTEEELKLAIKKKYYWLKLSQSGKRDCLIVSKRKLIKQ